MIKEEELREESVLTTARAMLSAARTAPKGRGIDHLYLSLIKKNDIPALSEGMLEYCRKVNAPDFFFRDAENILSADCIIIIGTEFASLGIAPCGLCGFAHCEERQDYPDHPCSFNTGDLGIAIGSAVSIAADHRIDNRILFTVGKYMTAEGLLPEKVRIAYAIPLSCKGKNPFFDRKPRK